MIIQIKTYKSSIYLITFAEKIRKEANSIQVRINGDG